MTSSGGTGRPAGEQDARNTNVPPPGPGTNDASSGRGAKTSGPIATEVVAALRAQEASESDGGKAPQSPNAPNTPNGRPPAPQSSNGTSAGKGGGSERPASAPDPAVNTRRQASQPDEGEPQPRGAAAARVATKNNRSRQDTTPRNDDNTTPNPWSQRAQQDSGDDQPAASANADQSASRQAQAQRPTAPVPPPSLVAKQRREAAASGAAAPPLTSPSAPPAPTPSAAPAQGAAGNHPTDDTQASIDAVPFESPKQKTARPAAARRGGRIRKARLRLMRVDPWSVMKTAFLLSVALGITLFVAVAVLWSVLDAAGVFESVDEIVTDMTASDTTAGIDINQYVELSRVLGFTTLIAVVDVVLLTALATLGAFLYNLSASLLGGLELTLAEDD